MVLIHCHYRAELSISYTMIVKCGWYSPPFAGSHQSVLILIVHMKSVWYFIKGSLDVSLQQQAFNLKHNTNVLELLLAGIKSHHRRPTSTLLNRISKKTQNVCASAVRSYLPERNQIQQKKSGEPGNRDRERWEATFIISFCWKVSCES